MDITYQQLIFSHFAGQTPPLQRRLIEIWLKKPANQELYYQWLEEWDRQNLQYHPDEDCVWLYLQQRTKQDDQLHYLKTVCRYLLYEGVITSVYRHNIN
jgi:transmembrane sensor